VPKTVETYVDSRPCQTEQTFNEHSDIQNTTDTQ